MTKIITFIAFLILNLISIGGFLILSWEAQMIMGIFSFVVLLLALSCAALGTCFYLRKKIKSAFIASAIPITILTTNLILTHLTN